MSTHVIIVGCQRSGTTLVGQVLGSHPDAILIDENDGLYQWTHAVLEKADDVTVETEFARCCRQAKNKYVTPEAHFGPDSLPGNGITHLILKAPNLTFEYPRIANAFVPNRIVYVVRDIRSVVASILRLTEVPMIRNQTLLIMQSPWLSDLFQDEISRLNNPAIGNMQKAAIIAKIKMSLEKQFIEAGLDVLRVRHEDLTQDPRTWILKLLDHAGLRQHPDCARHQEILLGFGPGNTHRSRAIDNASVNRWEEELSTSDEEVVWQEAGKLMTALGY